MLRRLRPLSLLAALAMPALGHQARASDLLASAPLDVAMFRDGEIRRSADVFGGWTLVCDKLVRLGRRFCSMNAKPVGLGTGVLALTVSTGDDGRPAALLHLPLGVSLPYGVRVRSAAAGHVDPEHRVGVTLCSATACEAVWTLDAADIAALRGGNGLRITLRGWRFAPSGARGRDPDAASAVIEGHGFAEAVTASLQE